MRKVVLPIFGVTGVVAITLPTRAGSVAFTAGDSLLLIGLAVFIVALRANPKGQHTISAGWFPAGVCFIALSWGWSLVEEVLLGNSWASGGLFVACVIAAGIGATIWEVAIITAGDSGNEDPQASSPSIGTG